MTPLLGWLIFAMLGVIGFILIMVALKFSCSEKKFYTTGTNQKVADLLSEQEKIIKQVGEELSSSGILNKRKWKKRLGKETYEFYMSHSRSE